MSVWIWLWFCIVYGGGRLAAATVGGWLLQMILCVAATATQLEMLSSLILGLHVMWKTPWACSTSSSDDRGFTCQLVFIILSRFVVYSLNSALAMLNISPSLFFFLPKAEKEEYGDYILFCSVWIISIKDWWKFFCGLLLSTLFRTCPNSRKLILGNGFTPAVKPESVW